VLGVLVLSGGLMAVYALLRFSFRFAGVGVHGASATLGGVLFAAILLVGVAAIMQIHFYRAAAVEALGETTYVVVPIVSILFRAAGEIYATFGVAVGVGGCLFMWLARFNPLSMLGGFGSLLPAIETEGSFLGGLFFLLYLAISSFTFLVLSYFLAEATLVIVDIARNVRSLAERGVGAGKCPRCSAPVESGAVFCPRCGTRLAH
jgi:zinc-ribbon domain